jgi:multisubunit Na+/H+ antiporter MnhB subunit
MTASARRPLTLNVEKVMRKRKRRLLDFALYAGIGIGVVTAVITAASHGSDMHRTMRWAGFGTVTLILFGILVSDYRAQRKNLRMWMVLGGCFFVHVVIGSLLISRIENIPPILFGVLYVAELPLLRAVVKRLLPN